MLRNTWIIGAAADCQLVVDVPTVSARHCRLTRTRGGLVLEDLGSTNGTFVNGQRITVTTAVVSGDRIGLGQEAPLSWDVLRHVLLEPRVSQPHWLPRSFRSRPVVTTSASVAVVALLVVILQFRGSAANEASRTFSAMENSNRTHSEQTMKNSRTDASAITQLAGEPSTSPPAVAAHEPKSAPIQMPTQSRLAAGIEPFPAGPQPTPTPKGVAVDPRRAIYAIHATAAKNGKTVQIGTAWAATENLLVTSGSIVQFLKLSHADFPTVTVRCEAQNQSFSVTGTAVHPEFKRLFAETRDAESTVKTQRERLSALSREGAESPAELDKLVEEIVALEERRFMATEQSVFFDIGLLRVDGQMTDRLDVAMSRNVPSPPQSLSLYGGAPLGSSVSSTARSEQPNQLVCELGTVPSWAGNDSPVTRWQLKCSSPHTDRDWGGSPILDVSGRVIGLFVRPTPPTTPQGKPVANQFDAVSIVQLRTLLPELFESGK